MALGPGLFKPAVATVVVNIPIDNVGATTLFCVTEVLICSVLLVSSRTVDRADPADFPVEDAEEATVDVGLAFSTLSKVGPCRGWPRESHARAQASKGPVKVVVVSHVSFTQSMTEVKVEGEEAVCAQTPTEGSISL